MACWEPIDVSLAALTPTGPRQQDLCRRQVSNPAQGGHL